MLTMRIIPAVAAFKKSFSSRDDKAALTLERFRFVLLWQDRIQLKLPGTL